MINKSESNLLPSGGTFGYMYPTSSDDPSAPSPPNPRGIASLLGGPAEGGVRLKPIWIEPLLSVWICWCQSLFYNKAY
jgi:hypothetical protein